MFEVLLWEWDWFDPKPRKGQGAAPLGIEANMNQFKQHDQYNYRIDIFSGIHHAGAATPARSTHKLIAWLKNC